MIPEFSSSASESVARSRPCALTQWHAMTAAAMSVALLTVTVTVGQKNPTRNYSISLFSIEHHVQNQLWNRFGLTSEVSALLSLAVRGTDGGRRGRRAESASSHWQARQKSSPGSVFQVESSSSKFIANLNFRSHTAATVLRSTSFGAGANPGHSDPAPAAIPGPELGYILMNYNTNDRNRIGVVIVIRCC